MQEDLEALPKSLYIYSNSSSIILASKFWFLSHTRRVRSCFLKIENSKFQKMEKEHFRFYIQVTTSLGETPTAIHQDFITFGRDKAISYSTVLKSLKRFKNEKLDIEDEPHKMSSSIRSYRRKHCTSFEALLKRIHTRPMRIYI